MDTTYWAFLWLPALLLPAAILYSKVLEKLFGAILENYLLVIHEGDAHAAQIAVVLCFLVMGLGLLVAWIYLLVLSLAPLFIFWVPNWVYLIIIFVLYFFAQKTVNEKKLWERVSKKVETA